MINIHVICCEFNPTIPDDVVYIQEQNDNVRHGSSLSALTELAEKHGFTLVETTLYNALFVQNELFVKFLKEQIPIDDTTIEALHELTMGTQLYQLYDGKIKLSGCKRMLWHRIRMNEESFQILPEAKREFPFAPTRPPVEDIAVDMSPFCDPQEIEGSKVSLLKIECSKKLVKALIKDGFAIISGTGMSSKVSQDALMATNIFFNEASEAVRRSCLAKDRARRGYSPMNSENFSSLIGGTAPNDLVRKFRVGQGRNNNIACPLYCPNTWPSGEIWDEDHANSFKCSIDEYYSEICCISHAVVKAIRDGLLQYDPTREQYLKVLDMGDDKVSHTSILTLLGYRKGARHQGKMKTPLVAPHTDIGVITVLRFDAGDCAALQRLRNTKIKNSDIDNWVDVFLGDGNSSKDPLFIVNVGDCLSEISNGVLPSTLHRVQPKPGLNPRNCLALFVGLNPNSQIKLENEIVTYENWRKRKIEIATKKLTSTGI